MHASIVNAIYLETNAALLETLKKIRVRVDKQ